MHQLICSVGMMIGALLAGALAARGQQPDANGLPPRSGALPAPQLLARPPGILSISFDSVRYLTELNRPQQADAYPWLSTDGLRLYYTIDTTFLRVPDIFLSTRTSLQQPFGPPRSLALSGYTSAWFTPDELNCWLVNSVSMDTLWRTSCATPTAAFAPPVPVRLLIPDLAYFRIGGPSLSAAGDELMLTVYPDVGGSDPAFLGRFTQIAPDTFALADTVALPFVPKPGQLFDHDLGYIFCGSDSMIYVIRRPTIHDPFGPPTEVEVRALAFKGQVTYQVGIDVMVFESGSQNLWLYDELWLATRSQGVLSMSPAFAPPPFQLTPNPAHHTVRLTGLPPTATTAQVIDALGRTVQTSALAALTANLSLTGLPPGLYTVRVGSAARRLVVE